jgi:hypothetical protein
MRMVRKAPLHKNGDGEHLAHGLTERGKPAMMLLWSAGGATRRVSYSSMGNSSGLAHETRRRSE